MILCIDKKALKKDGKVQKDIKLEELLLNHTKYFDGVLNAYEEDYVPLDFCVSVRSMYSNLVLSHYQQGHTLLYSNMTLLEETPHKGYDLVMYLASVAFTKRVKSFTGICDIMMKHSQIQPLGLLNLDHDLVNPVVYSHIILSDEGAEQIKKHLKSDCEFIPIKDKEKFRTQNVGALLDTLTIVRKEDENEQYYNY